MKPKKIKELEREVKEYRDTARWHYLKGQLDILKEIEKVIDETFKHLPKGIINDEVKELKQKLLGGEDDRT